MRLLYRILMSLSIGSCMSANGQVNVQNTGILSLTTNSDTLFISGSFVNANTSSFINNGHLQVKQTLTNNQSAMSVGTGTLYMNGTLAQSVSGSQVFKTFNLITNNTAGITLNNDLSVSGAHQYLAGLVVGSGVPNYLIYESGSSYSGSNDTRHATGWVKKIGSTNFTFPVGNNSYERPAGIKSLSGSAEINCHYYSPTQNIYNLTSPLIAVDSNEYWQLNKVSGGTLSVVLNWDHPRVTFYNVLVSDVTTATYNGSSWIDAGGSASGTATTTGSITSSPRTTLGTFTFGFKSYPIPLKLVSFTGERKAAVTYLSWITENEDNVSHFNVQRSNDGVNFHTIGTEAARNISLRQFYRNEDRAAIQGIVYYRLQSVDIDGKSSYSRIVAISALDIQSTGFYVPNPARGGITVLNKTGREGVYEYRLIQTNGSVMLAGRMYMQANGTAHIQVDPQIAHGLYILEITGNDIRFHQKILVDK
jgi:hypothetical protein